jgi:hypothetical protein
VTANLCAVCIWSGVLGLIDNLFLASYPMYAEAPKGEGIIIFNLRHIFLVAKRSTYRPKLSKLAGMQQPTA